MEILRDIPFVSAIAEAGYLPHLLAVVALLVVLILVRTAGKSGGDDGKNASRGLAREALKLEKAGRRDEAAVIFRQLERPEDAVRCYVALENFVAAGELLEGLGRYEEAEEMYARADSRSNLKNLWTSRGMWDKVGEAMSSEGKHAAAADAFERAELFEQAALEYEADGNFEKAGEFFEKADNHRKSAEMYEKAYFRERSLTRNRPELAETSALNYTASGMPGIAARMYLIAGKSAAAAECYKSAGMFREAGDLLYRMMEKERAAECYRSAGDGIRASLTMAEWHESQARHAEAAVLYAEGENFIRAAYAYSKAGMFAEAGAYYAKTGDFRTAADCLDAGGDRAKAAEMYLLAGEFELAARLFLASDDVPKAIAAFERGNRQYDAALLLVQTGLAGQAAAMLKKIPNDSPVSREANLLLGNILRDSGLHSESVEAYRKAAAGMELGAGTLDLYSKLADVMEKSGMASEAAAIAEKIHSYKPGFRRV
ncbi:MAG: hypothetical protein HZA20_02240 [Nitrospirae bacterium]|nr:hypothetical protein [Nitrospirota bacterium]